MNDKRLTLQEMLKYKHTKEYLQKYYNCNERTVRASISTLSHTLPIISISTDKGYKIASTEKDLYLAMHAYNENEKRAKEILKRQGPLKEFIDKMRLTVDNLD